MNKREKESLTAEATTERLVKLLDDATVGLYGIDEGREAIRHRILAADHSVDLREFFDLDPATASPGRAYIAKVQHGNCKPIAIPAYQEGGVWLHTCGAAVRGKVIALADPAKLIEGASAARGGVRCLT